MQLQGAQNAAAQAQQQKNQAIEGIVGGAASALGYGSELVPLYKNKQNQKKRYSLHASNKPNCLCRLSKVSKELLPRYERLLCPSEETKKVPMYPSEIYNRDKEQTG